jgi:uncharacterized protein YvpB
MPVARLWNTLGLFFMGLTALTGLVSVWFFMDPYSRLNPFPPASPPPLVSSSLVTPPAGSGEVSLAPVVVSPAATLLRYPTLPPEWTKTPVPPPTFTRTPRPTHTPTVTSTPIPTDTTTPTLTPTPTLPKEARVTGVVGHRQTLSLSCESRSAADWAAYFGVTLDEMEFFNRLPVSDNPEVGFVGDVNGEWGYLPPKAYGVHAGPVADLLRAYGASAQAQRGLSWEDLQKEIIAGRPVIVWIVGHLWEGKPVTYSAEDGQTVTVARYEHTVIFTGYSATRVIVVDGENIYAQPVTTFLRSWSVLGNMAILWKP